MLGAHAALITGASGSGKSTLALELVALGATLVADDRIDVIRNGQTLSLAPPEQIKGLIEARGAGLIRMPWVSDVPLALIVDLDHPPTQRFPANRNRDLLGISCPVIFGQERWGLAAVVAAILSNGLVDPD